MSSLMSHILVEEAQLLRQKNEQKKSRYAALFGDYYDSVYFHYAQCSFCGVVASTIRWPLSPLELIKTRMQVFPAEYTSVWQGFSRIVSQEGWIGLSTGWAPTALAYGFQTGTKYALYELLKDVASAAAAAQPSQQHQQQQQQQQLPIHMYILSAAAAEAVADIFMCPWEMMRVRVQTDPSFLAAAAAASASSGQSSSSSFPQAFRHMWRYRHAYQFPFGSLGPLMGRQIPATVVNFVTFEYTVRTIYQHVLPSLPFSSSSSNKHHHHHHRSTELIVSMVAGFVAGAACAVASHPFDSIVSRMGSSTSTSSIHTSTARQSTTRQSVQQIVQQVGWYRLATQGLATRMMLTGGVISMQWFLYDGIRTLLGMPTTGNRGGSTEAEGELVAAAENQA